MSVKTGAKPATRRLTKAARRDQLLGAAAEAFAQKGFAATSMEVVGSAAGVTRVVLYRHFASKSELYEAVLDRVVQAQFEALAKVPQDAGENRRRFVATSVLRVARQDPHGFRLLWGHAASEPEFANYATKVRSLIIRRTSSMFESLTRDERFRRWAAATTVDYLFAAVLNWLEYGDPTQDEWLVEAISRSLAVHARIFEPKDRDVGLR